MTFIVTSIVTFIVTFIMITDMIGIDLDNMPPACYLIFS